MLSYIQVADAVGKPVEEVREARKLGAFELEDLPSVVKYVAGAWGWISPEQLKDITVSEPTSTPVSVSPPVVTIPIKSVPNTNAVWTVQDNYRRPEDPYLDRVRPK